ncbi:MAG: hypothetical protein P4N59_33135 [Negativicutes bacterium]|nr:hypothetical protein [Negativicutes bacterium]
MQDDNLLFLPPLDGMAVRTLETALGSSPTKTILLEINQALYQLSREGRWFKFSLLTKKRSPKRSTLFATITEVYNQMMHGHSWRIADYAI